jgi:hypothetical protein
MDLTHLSQSDMDHQSDISLEINNGAPLGYQSVLLATWEGCFPAPPFEPWPAGHN